MSYFTRLRSRVHSWLRAVTHPSRLHNDMDTELRFHVESYVEDLVRSGVPLEEATRRARIEFGSVPAHKEAMRASLGLQLWDELWADLRYAVRMLRKSPGFTAIAVGSLALGIGANALIFTVAKQVLFDRLAVPHPEQLRLLSWIGGKHVAVHMVWGEEDALPNGQSTSTSFIYPVYQQLRRQNHVLQDLFAFKDAGRLTATVDGHAGIVQSEFVSGNYYQQLEVRPAIGRAILPSDDAVLGSGAVVVISDGYWARRFGRSPSIIGKTINLNLVPVTIIGVNPPGFTGAKGVQTSPEVFLPFSIMQVILPNRDGPMLDNIKLWWMQIMGRVKPGVPQQTAQASLDVALNAAVRATMHLDKGETVPHIALSDGSRGLNNAGSEFAHPIYVLMALVGFVLLLACANIANLLLARSAARQREISVRLALGAGRARILRQALTESLLLSALGGFAGLLLAYGGRNAIPNLLSSPWEPATLSSHFDWRVFAFTAAVTLITGLLFGIAPAWQATRTQLNSALKDSSQTATHRRKGYAGKAIVVFQIALSTLLVVGAGLFLGSLFNLDSVNPGFQPKNILLLGIQAPKSRYPYPQDIALYRRLEVKLASVPGVSAVTLSAVPLIAHSMWNDTFVPTGEPTDSKKKRLADFNQVGESFFSTMRIPILAGRSFNERDTETSPKVAIVNRRLAREFFPGANPIGKTFNTGQNKGTPIEIVGVCADAKFDDLRKEAPSTFYMSYRQSNTTTDPGSMTYEIKTRMKPAAITASLRSAVQSVDKNLPLIDVRTQEEQIAATMQQQRIFANLTTGFGILALVLACIGIYGIMAYTVARRTNEIGVRLALGAQRNQVRAMILRETSWLAVAGVFAGLGAALLLSRFLRTMLYGLKPDDPATLVGAAVLLFAVALLAGWVPARRASQVEPMQALRHE